MKINLRVAKLEAFKCNLICPDCGIMEGPPFEVGDECICGGHFQHKTCCGTGG